MRAAFAAVLLSVALAAGAASAAPADAQAALAAAVIPGADIGPAIAGRPIRVTDPDREPRLPRGIARTAVERRLASEDLVGSVGFLCGLKPGAERFGAAAAHGYDPTGRFVGAKLSLAFR